MDGKEFAAEIRRLQPARDMALLSPDVEPLWIAHYDYERGAVLPLHSHRDYFQLISIVDGDGEALVGTERLPLRPGQLLFLRPGLSHGLEAGIWEIVRTLDTKFRIRHRGLRRACERLGPVQSGTDRRIVTLLQAMHTEAQRAGRVSAEICQTLLVQVLLLLLRQEHDAAPASLPLAEEGGRGADLCNRLHGFLRENCGEKITQRRLSAHFHFSYHHLHAVYRSRYRESPLRALRRYRVERAMQLIRYSDYELKQIAELTGFATIHHFTRVFASVSGTSPARWRDQDSRERKKDVVIHPGFVNQYLTRVRSE